MRTILFFILISLNIPAFSGDLGITKYGDCSSGILVYPFYPRDIHGESFEGVSLRLCDKGYTKTVRKVSKSVKNLVMKKYGLRVSDSKDVEIDHFISLELNGNNTPENLWPQPYEVYLVVNGKNRRMGAREKDVVETNLHKRICRGEITVQEGQRVITTNWVGYYLRIKHLIK